MSNCLHAKISDVPDSAFQQLIEELYHCVGWKRNDEDYHNAFYLISAICAHDFGSLTIEHLPGPGILTTSVGKLAPGVVYDFCAELVRIRGSHIEAFDRKTVLTLIKSCFPRQKSARPRIVTGPRHNHHDSMTRLILQRRANGDL